MATRSAEPLVARHTRIARRARIGFVAVIGTTLIALLSYERFTHGLEQSGVTELLGATLIIVPIAVLGFFALDVAGCIVSVRFARRHAGGREQGHPLGRALVETLLTPALVYLEILVAAWLRSR